jgi:hypothetical protein
MKEGLNLRGRAKVRVSSVRGVNDEGAADDVDVPNQVNEAIRTPPQVRAHRDNLVVTNMTNRPDGTVDSSQRNTENLSGQIIGSADFCLRKPAKRQKFTSRPK